MNPQEQKIQELENRIRDLENVSNETYLRNAINVLLRNGFVQINKYLASLTGYDAGATQTLKNITGTLTLVTD